MEHTFVLSDESINSYGFKVLTAGIDTSVFEENPVMLYEHKSIHLIGRWERVRVEGNRLKADAVFDSEDELAGKIGGKVERGFLKGVSIGFQILETGQERTPDGAVVPVVKRCKLMEASLCAIPSNANALRLYNEKGRLMAESEMKLAVNRLLSTGKDSNFSYSMNIHPENLKALGLSGDFSQSRLNDALADLIRRLHTAETHLAEWQKQKVTTLLDKAVSDGRIKASQREHFEKLAEADFDRVKNILEDSKTPSKPTDHLLKDKEKERSDWDFDRWRKEDPKGLANLRKQDPEQYKNLLSKSSVSRHITV